MGRKSSQERTIAGTWETQFQTSSTKSLGVKRTKAKKMARRLRKRIRTRTLKRMSEENKSEEDGEKTEEKNKDKDPKEDEKEDDSWNLGDTISNFFNKESGSEE